MPELELQRRLAAQILKVGRNRIWMDPDARDKIKLAITRKDVSELIQQGIIKPKPERGQSRSRLKSRKRKRGHGSRKGARAARSHPKQMWMNQVRALRSRLKLLRDRGMITRSSYRKLYRLVKGAGIRTVAQLTEYLKKHELIQK